MKLNVDSDADTAYLRLRDADVLDSREVSPGIVLDFDADGVVVGIEILDLNTRGSGLTEVDILTQAA